MNIRRLDHLVLAVDDLAAALDAWQFAFEIDASAPEQPAGTHMEIAVLNPANIAEHASPEPGRRGAFLELVRATTDTHRVARHVAELGEGMFSISLQVDNLDAAVAELRGKDVEVSDPEPGVIPNTRVARIPRARAFGVAIQLIQR